MANCTMCTKFGECPWQTNPNSYCSAYEQRAMTNADRIRSMSDEELAEWIIGMLAQEIIYAAAKVPTPDQTIEARKWWLDWLRQECE